MLVLVSTLLAGAGAAAAPGDGVLTVQVDRDFSGDGLYDPVLDPPQAGVDVIVTDGSTTIGPLPTDDAGQVVIDLGDFEGSSFRIDVEITDPALDHLQPAPAATAPAAPNAFRSATTFVGPETQTVHIGVWNPLTYGPADPPLAVIQQVESGADGDIRSVGVTGWDNRGPSTMDTATNYAGITTVATQADTGTVFGSAWDYRTDTIYTAAYAKANTPYGPGGNGAIYATDAGGGGTEVFAVVPDAGTSAHTTDDVGRDDAFFLANGREGLGGLALAEDGSALYVVNLNNRSLHTVDPATGAVDDGVPIADPGCVGGDWRPFAVTARDGDVYVGGVCDASDSLARSDLAAHVLRLEGSTFAPVFSQPLDFARGAQNYTDPTGNLTGPGVSTHWNPWREQWDADLDDYFVTRLGPLYPTPMLTSIQFENDNSLVLGFRDRTWDMLVPDGFPPGGGDDTVTGGVTGGDLNRACLIDGTYYWEGTGGCADNHTAGNSGGEPEDRVEYFPGDFLDASLRYPDSTVRHFENSLGGIALSPRQSDVAATIMDPTGLFNTAGVGFYDRQDGTGPGNDPLANGLIVAGSEAWNFGKGSGLGDLSLLAAQAPIQIGNRVWFDADHDGEQDAPEDEPGIPGAIVRLLVADGETVLAETVTDEHGEYYFGGEGGYPLEPGVEYVIEFDVSEVDASTLPGEPDPSSLFYTLLEEPDAGSEHDSNADPISQYVARTTVIAPEPGGVDHSIDAGIWAQRAGIDIVKFDARDETATPADPVDGPDAVDDEYGGPTAGDWDPAIDADTSEDAVEYGVADSSTGPQPVQMIVTNTGSVALTDVEVADLTLVGPAVTGLTCDFSPLGGPAEGVSWSGPFAAGDSFVCSATLTMGGGEEHQDIASVQAQPVNEQGEPLGEVIGDEDPYWARTPADPGVSITKRDAATGEEADTADDAVDVEPGGSVIVEMPVTNTGDVPLAEVVVSDVTDTGPAMTELECTFPDGSTATAVDGSVAWAATFDAGTGVLWQPAVTFTCTGVVTLAAGDVHADTVTVTAIAPDGTEVVDDDPFHARAQEVPPSPTPSEPAPVPTDSVDPSLPSTGAQLGIGALALATILLAAGAMLVLGHRRHAARR